MQKLLASALITATACVGTVLPAGAQGLAGIDSLKVVIEDLPEEARRAGLSEGMLRTRVELSLRRTGIRVWSGDVGAYLYLNVNVLEWEETGFVYSVNLNLSDFAIPPRQIRSLFMDSDTLRAQVSIRDVVMWAAGERAFVSVWDTARLGYVGRRANSRDAILGSVDHALDAFLNDYLAANPLR